MKKISLSLFVVLLWVCPGVNIFSQNTVQKNMAKDSADLSTARQQLAEATALFYAGKYDSSMVAVEKVLDLQAKLLPKNHPDRVEALQLVGKIYLEKGQIEKAFQYIEQALKIAQSCFGEISAEKADLLVDQGTALLYDDEYDQAEATLEQALAMQQKTLAPEHPDFARSYLALGTLQKYFKKYDDALSYCQKALEIRLKFYGESHRLLAHCYSEIGEIYLKKLDYAKVVDYFQKGNAIMIKNGQDLHPDYGYVCNDLGRAYLAMANYPEAIAWQQKALAIFRKENSVDNEDIATVILYIGRAQVGNGDYPEAIKSFEEDRRILIALNGPGSERLKYSYEGEADAYRKWFLLTGQDSLLQRSRYYYRFAEKIIEQTLRNDDSPATQKKVLYEAVTTFEKAIKTEILQAQQHPEDASALEKAWQLSESMHSYLLLSTTQDANARHFASIPDTELAKDSMLRAEMTALGNKRASLLEEGLLLTDSLVLGLNAQIYAKKEENIRLVNYFEQRFPDYFRLKFDLKTVSLSQAQQMLEPQQTLLEYFTGDSSIFVFVLHRNDSQVLELPRNFPLATWVQDLREGISGYHTAKVKKHGQYEMTVRQYADYAQKLHQKLLAPIAAYLTPELIVIPGDMLANIPFEALLAGVPKDIDNFKTYPFVLRNHTIQYAYSVTMLQQMIARQHRALVTDDMLAVAPFFDEDSVALAQRLAQHDALRLGISPLPYSGEEVVKVKTRFGGKSKMLIGKAATKQQFIALAHKYQVLHLATHGKANHRAGDFSYLAFAVDEDHPENGLLSVGELYNCSLNADLVVLSACETGIGEELRGEGVISLARAFAFAGAKSIVSSLWSVNDKSTMQVMENFYTELNLGTPKNIALANAKKQYLEQNPGREAHPFYWASFVALGDMRSIKK